MKKPGLLILILFIAQIIYAQTGKKLTLEDVLVRSTFREQTVKGLKPMNDGEHYTTLENGSRIVRHSYRTGEQAGVVFDISTVENAPINGFVSYAFSDDETKILLTTDVQKIYRHSFTAQ